MLEERTSMSQVPAPSPSPVVAQLLEARGIALIRQIATGGMSEVYEGRRGKQRVAIKLFRPVSQTSQNLARALVREAELMQRLHHPNLIEVLDAGQLSDDTYIIIMPYAAGGTLQQRLADLKKRNQRMSERDALRVARCVASALEYVHAEGIIHRDIKPSNILFMATRGAAKLADFSVAENVEEAVIPAGAAGQLLVLGTPKYAAPEQAQGRADVRSDIYGLGIVLYEMLAGAPPFESESPSELVRLHATASLPPLVRQVSAETLNVIARATAKNPLYRFQSAREMREAIERAIVWLPARQLERALQQAARRFVLPLLAAVGAAALLLICACLILAMIVADRLEGYLSAEQTWSLPAAGVENRLSRSEAQRIAGAAAEHVTFGLMTVSDVVLGPTTNRVELGLRVFWSQPVSMVVWLTAPDGIPSIIVVSIGASDLPVISDAIEDAVNRGVLVSWQRLGRRLRSIAITPDGEMIYVLA
ncbi:MAG: serine/threonine protein kinase [Chloroflexi bacterium]|nr:MAG: serine/threonine protein kinase [Chloroflexota bacterium]